MKLKQAPRPCATPGCPELVRHRHRRYCARCAAMQSRADAARRGTAAQRGYDANWRRIRAAFLASHPCCADPFHVHGDWKVLATEVDHIVPLRLGGTHDASNLQALCRSCHSRKSLNELRRGRGK